MTTLRQLAEAVTAAAETCWMNCDDERSQYCKEAAARLLSLADADESMPVLEGASLDRFLDEGDGLTPLAPLVRQSDALAALAAKDAEIAALKTVMIAAAEEISAHWAAHCEADGYGPANLIRRLEEGIPSEYGYTAGAFAELKTERDELRAYAERYRWLRASCECMGDKPDEAIDAARAKEDGNG